MKFPCVIENALLIIRDHSGLSFAIKRIGPPCCTLITIASCHLLQIILLSNYSLPIISVLAENTLLKTACHFLLLLVGFDTLTYRKDYDWSLILVRHQGAPWIHGYERLYMCKAGEVRPHSKITWLSWRSWQDSPELGTHASKDKQESDRDVIRKLAYRLWFPSSMMITSMALNYNMGLESLTINYERYWFEWERSLE
jgi:hypothetical protein